MKSELRGTAVGLKEKYLHQGIFIDTNLLLLVFTGNIDERAIENHKRLGAYSRQDYAILMRFLTGFEKRFCIPNVMTEISNLIPKHHRCHLQKFVRVFEEHYVPSIEAVNSLHLHFGLTDAAILLNPKGKGALYLTDDFALYGQLLSTGFDALNFNHLREIVWDE